MEVTVTHIEWPMIFELIVSLNLSPITVSNRKSVFVSSVRERSFNVSFPTKVLKLVHESFFFRSLTFDFVSSSTQFH